MAEHLTAVTTKGHLQYASNLVSDIVRIVSKPFDAAQQHTDSDYSLPSDNELAFFPNLQNSMRMRPTSLTNKAHQKRKKKEEKNGLQRRKLR